MSSLFHAMPGTVPLNACGGATIFVERMSRYCAAVKLLTRAGDVVEVAICPSQSMAEAIAYALKEANPSCALELRPS